MSEFLRSVIVIEDLLFVKHWSKRGGKRGVLDQVPLTGNK